jgi:hypothetical protein
MALAVGSASDGVAALASNGFNKVRDVLPTQARHG